MLTKPAQIHHLEMQKNGLDFGDLDLIFNVTGGQRMLKKCLVCTLSPEGIGGF